MPSLESIDNRCFEVAIVGGGINGCTSAARLAEAGYSVLLIEKLDFASGATGRSGRTLHCGLQCLAPRKSVWEYVANPSDMLTRLAATKRYAHDFIELQNAIPHRLTPMETVVPIFEDSAFRGWQVDIGARIIRWFTHGRSDFSYRRFQPASDSHNPFLDALRNRNKLRSAVSFVDYRFDWPERIAIDNALAAESMGAVVRNFTTVKSLARGPNNLWKLELQDTLGQHARTSGIHARMVINLAGPWLDKVLDIVTPSHSHEQIITGVKGVYFAVRLPVEFKGRGFGGINRLGEPITCLPMGEFHYIGPTQTAYQGDAGEAMPDEESIKFLLSELKYLLPGLKIGREDLVFAWAGVRAVNSRPGQPKGQWMPYSVLHDLSDRGFPNIIALSWGILVHHRSTAEGILKIVESRIHKERMGSQKRRINDRDVLAFNKPNIIHCIENEKAQDIYGILFSRLGSGWNGQITRKMVELTGTILAQTLGWNPSQIAKETSDFEAKIAREHLLRIS